MVLPRLELSEAGSTTAARFTGTDISLDEAATGAVWEEVSALAGRLNGRELVFDLSNVRFLNSTALGMFLLLRRRLQARGRRFRLVNAQPQIAEVFRVTRLSALFESPPPLAV